MKGRRTIEQSSVSTSPFEAESGEWEIIPNKHSRTTSGLENQNLGAKPLTGDEIDGANYLCAWGNDAASEVITEARQLLVENYFQTPSSAWA